MRRLFIKLLCWQRKDIHNEKLLVDDGFNQRRANGMLRKQTESESAEKNKIPMGDQKGQGRTVFWSGNCERTG